MYDPNFLHGHGRYLFSGSTVPEVLFPMVCIENPYGDVFFLGLRRGGDLGEPQLPAAVVESERTDGLIGSL